ncbi:MULTISPECIES: alpha/beta hydrolase [Nostocales]|uniref:Alpha/beta hydrolase n=3 Tax=Nostocales TaxID=1161 RepID=A0A0C1QUW8_9CYAN|nr:alpha/beta fold hydrolase [Tolypothrix bouteillei]KAF3884942.1 alpha/beta hydrolase [Tolypothrix bouteillei VB521301]
MIINKLQQPIQLLFVFTLFAIVIAYCAVCILLFLRQSRFIFFPSSIVETTPEFFNLNYEEVWLPVSVSSGKVQRVHGWWLPSSQPDSKVLLYFHGNSINIGANVVRAHRFHQLGFSVFLFDYRGYGCSEGSFPSELRIYQDAATAWEYLVSQRKISPNKIFLYGHSLGGAVAIDLAVKHPEAAGLIVEGSFTSIRQMIAHRNNFWMLPVNLILKQRFDSIVKVPNLKIPVLFIHGTADEVVPAFMSKTLYEAAPAPKDLVLIPGAEHNDVAEVAPSVYCEAVQSFVKHVQDRSSSQFVLE